MHVHITADIQKNIPLVLAVCDGEILGEKSLIPQSDTVKQALSMLKLGKGKYVDICVESGQRIIFLDVGTFESVYEIRCQGGALWNLCQSLSYSALQILPWSSFPEELLYGLMLKGWRFDGYRTKSNPLPKLFCKDLYVIYNESIKGAPSLTQQIERYRTSIESIHWTRQRCNEPANILTPQKFSQDLTEFSEFGIRVEIIEKASLESLGFGALLGVAQGSIHEARLAVLQWHGAASCDAPWVTLVGKGVTFDTGGVSLKPSSGMESMKMDMSGAAVVAGVIRAAAIDKLPLNLSVVIPLVENAISGTAQRPGDIVRSLSGQTIEVLNTDAEGRLILADALWYAQEKFNPHLIIDVATLTGAVRVALGPEYAGIFGTCEKTIEAIRTCGKEEGEKFWHLPLDSAFDRALDSDCADMKNIASPGYGAGSSIGAQFLKRFIKPEQKWIHLDIASVDHLTADHLLCPKGGSGFGVQTLYSFLLKKQTFGCCNQGKCCS
ncbi:MULTISPECIES: leucyl aminopeptidase [Holospora]|uniref:Putative cytosol aminopeptidase n=2 Tax=Holospora TaxID=44747 RepID=A0A061JI49_9PROT|nr:MULTISPECIES: leucyl aminopeptidase [Holospora]ETZ05227.1 putative cytosol aminopeptidase [Holospora undulata HU1]GAJ46264.1 putative cytosol aminopeptidase [Holospora elegans E1]